MGGDSKSRQRLAYTSFAVLVRSIASFVRLLPSHGLLSEYALAAVEDENEMLLSGAVTTGRWVSSAYHQVRSS